MWRAGRACGWKYPRAPRISLLFGDERATPAVLTFLRDTKVVPLEALGGGRGVGGGGGPSGGGGRGGGRPPLFLRLSLVRPSFLFLLLLRGAWGAGD